MKVTTTRKIAAFVAAALVFLLVWQFYAAHRRAQLSLELVAAVVRHDTPGVESLLAQGADPNTRDWSYYGSKGGPFIPPWYEKYLAKLMRRPARVADAYIGPTVLMTAVYYGDSVIVKSLLDHGAELTKTGTPIEDAFSIDKFHSPVPPLYEAIENGDIAMSRLLLQRGAPVNFRVDGLTPLMLTDNAQIAAALLDKGADVNAGADANAADDVGKTPLIFAIEKSHSYSSGYFEDETDQQRAAIVLLLLKRGANINVMLPSGVTPLSAAEEARQYGLVKLLLKHGADPNLRDPDGNTELTSAAANGGDLTYLRLLLTYGANVNAQNNKGQTALMFVSHVDYDIFSDWRAMRHAKIQLLLRFGANARLRDKQGKTAANYFNLNPPEPSGS